MFKVLREITEDNISGSTTSSSDLYPHLIMLSSMNCWDNWHHAIVFWKHNLFLQLLVCNDLLIFEMLFEMVKHHYCYFRWYHNH